MKRILLLILLYFISIVTHSQTTNEQNLRQTLVGGRYLITETKTLTSDVYPVTTDVILIKDDYVEIINEEGEDVTFQSVDAGTNVNLTNTVTIQTLPKYLFFYYAKQQFRIYKGASVGMYTIPYKLRIGSNCDFEAALSLATNLTFGIGTRDSKESYLDASVGIGVTSISLTENNSNVTENRTATGFSLSFGLVGKFAKNANLGVFLGGDFLNANDRKMNWIYNEKLWVGVGINISFSKAETSKAPDGTPLSETEIDKVEGKKAEQIKALKRAKRASGT